MPNSKFGFIAYLAIVTSASRNKNFRPEHLEYLNEDTAAYTIECIEYIQQITILHEIGRYTRVWVCSECCTISTRKATSAAPGNQHGKSV